MGWCRREGGPLWSGGRGQVMSHALGEQLENIGSKLKIIFFFLKMDYIYYILYMTMRGILVVNKISVHFIN